MSDTKGSLTVVGSGIRSVSQLTLETISCLESADIVYYVLTDPVTEGFIRRKNTNCIDLAQYYALNKPRMETYIQMAEVMVQTVRSGKNVVGIFYGHPGNFVSPSRRALAIAREEGYPIRMLPAISAEDCLLADLLVDPAVPGTQIFEASDLLVYNRPIVTSGHVIIYQPGCVGKVTYFASENMCESNSHFIGLVDRLAADYGDHHTVVNYIAATSPLSKPIIQKYKIADLYTPEVQATINACSTWYIPPKELLSIDKTNPFAQELLDSGIKSGWQQPPLWTDTTSKPHELSNWYGDDEKKAIENLATHEAPKERRIYNASPALQDVVERIVLDPKVLQAYIDSPVEFAKSQNGLSEKEIEALCTGHVYRIYKEMWLNYGLDTDQTTEGPTWSARGETSTAAVLLALVPPLAPPVAVLVVL